MSSRKIPPERQNIRIVSWVIDPSAPDDLGDIERKSERELDEIVQRLREDRNTKSVIGTYEFICTPFYEHEIQEFLETFDVDDTSTHIDVSDMFGDEVAWMLRIDKGISLDEEYFLNVIANEGTSFGAKGLYRTMDYAGVTNLLDLAKAVKNSKRVSSAREWVTSYEHSTAYHDPDV